MPNEPHKHHYVPCFYLKGFTKAGKDNGELFVLDQRRCNTWKSTPKNSAHQHDFHAIETHSDADRMVIEKEFANIEGECSQVIYALIEKQEIPTGQAHDILVNFIAMMAVRVPEIRNTISNSIDSVMKNVARSSLRDGQLWEKYKQHCESSGKPVDTTQEELRKFLEGDDYSLDFDQSWHVGMMLELGSKLVPILAKRNWAIWIAEDGVPDFICSDRPACLTWCTAEKPPIPPGFAHQETVVTIPINRRIVVAGRYEDQPPMVTMDAQDIAIANRCTLEYANQLYSAESDFVWAMSDERLSNATDLLDMLRAKVPS